MLTDNKVKSLKPKQKRYSIADDKGLRYRLDYITSNFKNTAVNDVSRAMVTKAVDAMVKKGTFEMAKRSLKLLSPVFNYGIAHKYTQSNPCVLVANIISNRSEMILVQQDSIYRHRQAKTHHPLGNAVKNSQKNAQPAQ